MLIALRLCSTIDALFHVCRMRQMGQLCLASTRVYSLRFASLHPILPLSALYSLRILLCALYTLYAPPYPLLLTRYTLYRLGEGRRFNKPASCGAAKAG